MSNSSSSVIFSRSVTKSVHAQAVSMPRSGRLSVSSQSSTSSVSHLHAGRHLFHATVRIIRARGALCAHALHLERQRYIAGFFELQRQRHLVALLEGVLEIEQHQMIPARRKLYRLAGL